MKKLLFITAVPPSNNGGGELLTLTTIKSLSKKFDVDLIYFSYPGHKNLATTYVKNEYEYTPRFRNCLSRFYLFPLFTKRFDKKVLKMIQEKSAEYDILFFDFSQTAIYARYVSHSYKVVRCHDIIMQKYFRKAKFLIPWIKFSENKVLKGATKVYTLSEKDTELVKKNYDINAYTVNDFFAKSDFQLQDTLQMENSFIFYGYWGRLENLDGFLWFVKKVIPKISTIENYTFKVMGKGLPEKIIEQYLKPHNIEYLGFVDNSLEEISTNNAVIAPLFQGAGVKIKVIEAFQTGTPVIGTSVAFEGIPHIDDLTYLCNSPEEFAKVIENFVPLSIERKKERKEFFEKFVDKGRIVDTL